MGGGERRFSQLGQVGATAPHLQFGAPLANVCRSNAADGARGNQEDIIVRMLNTLDCRFHQLAGCPGGDGLYHRSPQSNLGPPRSKAE
jgi:hypothetical protein